MQYLIVEHEKEPFFTNWFSVENNYVDGMIVFDTHIDKYYDGSEWKKIKHDPPLIIKPNQYIIMKYLTTVPTFTFPQGDLFDGGEYPITVKYFQSGNSDVLIELEQEDRYVNIQPQHLKLLVKMIEKHLPEAKKELTKVYPSPIKK